MSSINRINSLIIILLAGFIQGCTQHNDDEVNVYSARKEALIKPLLDEFQQQTGIKVNLVTGKADALIERLKAEGGSTPADVLITVDAGRLYRAQNLDLTQSVQSDVLDNFIPSHLREPSGHWYGMSLRARPIIYALDRIAPEQLSTYEDLASDKWLGKICIRSSTNIYNQSLVASMVAASGEPAVEDWAEAVVANFARDPVGGDRDQIKAVAAGQCDLAVANSYYLFGMLQSDDEIELNAAKKVGVFWPNQSGRGTHVNISGIALTKAAKNKDNGIKLMEFLSTEASQSWYANANGEYPVSAEVAVNPLLASWGEFKQDQVNLVELGKHNAQAVKLLDRAGWQ